MDASFLKRRRDLHKKQRMESSSRPQIHLDQYLDICDGQSCLQFSEVLRCPPPHHVHLPNVRHDPHRSQLADKVPSSGLWLEGNKLLGQKSSRTSSDRVNQATNVTQGLLPATRRRRCVQEVCHRAMDGKTEIVLFRGLVLQKYVGGTTEPLTTNRSAHQTSVAGLYQVPLCRTSGEHLNLAPPMSRVQKVRVQRQQTRLLSYTASTATSTNQERGNRLS